jgi:hypothetical protein
MKKEKTTEIRSEEAAIELIEEIKCKLHDLDQKLDYLIKNLRRFNSRHDPYNSTSDLMD